ncbi:MAG: hypothetical protein IPK82_42840 [Polyangiaceae bacterium]|nr:hypothetical protein [Polyangiaceae bacterium]
MSEKQLITQLAALKQALRAADAKEAGSFARVFHAFFDITDGPDLMRLGKPGKNPELRAALERMSREFLGDDTLTLSGIKIATYAPAGFFHGLFFVSGAHATFFYFGGERQGLVSYNRGSLTSDIFRITTVPIPDGATPVTGPRGTA